MQAALATTNAHHDEKRARLIATPPPPPSPPPTIIHNKQQHQVKSDVIEDHRTARVVADITTRYGVYSGEVNDLDQEHGEGVLRCTNGEVFRGRFENGQMSHGELTHFTSGSVYVGGFKKNRQKSGFGRIVYGANSTGDTEQFKSYEGQWHNNKPHGEGCRVYINDDVYTGGMQKSQRSGQGCTKYASGDVFEGGYLKDQRDGPGKVTCLNGVVLRGVWSGGELVKEEELVVGKLYM
eukprot:gene26347-32914_t